MEDLFDRSLHREPYRKGNGQPNLSTVTITGPQPGTAAVSDSPSRRKVLTCPPAAGRRSGPVREKDHLDAGAPCVPAARDHEDLQVLLASYRDGASEADSSRASRWRFAASS